MDISVKKYMRADQSVPFQRWYSCLDKPAMAKVSTAIFRLQKGNFSRVKWFSGIGEYVIDWGPGYRIYLARDGETVILLLGGGSKKHQQIDITRAKNMHAEFKLRKRTNDGGKLWS